MTDLPYEENEEDDYLWDEEDRTDLDINEIPFNEEYLLPEDYADVTPAFDQKISFEDFLTYENFA
jgi:hypothetical protein